MLLRFGGVWVDVKIVFFCLCVSLLARFGGVWVDVKIGLFRMMRREVTCVVGGFFRASRLGLHRCF